MVYTYIAYTANRKLVKGKLNAPDSESANKILNSSGYQVINLKQTGILASIGKSFISSGKISKKDIMLFSRQLALLIESGNDLVRSLDLIAKQTTNKNLQNTLHGVINDIRGGDSFSKALEKYPTEFPRIYCQAIAAGEQAGDLHSILKQMALYLEREVETQKKVKNALTYPIIIVVLAIAVLTILSVFVMPVFSNLFSSFGAKLPIVTQIMISIASWLSHYILYLIFILLALGLFTFFYVKTPRGKQQWDMLALRLPVIGRISLLNELSRACRTMSLLFRVGLPLPVILNQVILGSSNKIVAQALNEVNDQLMNGEGLAKPMSRNPIFLPLMVQMISVGEETGNLDTALSTVAVTYEAESDDKTSSAIGLLQPALTIGIALIVGFLAVSLVSAMYGIYGQVNF